MVSRSLRTRRAISASSTHKMTGRTESGGKGLIWLHPLDKTTILHAARELSRSAEYSYILSVHHGRSQGPAGAWLWNKRILGAKTGPRRYIATFTASMTPG